MMLDQERCYRAVQSRDARFDGRFFTAVKTTGVYCRPVCPARTPKLQNVAFYLSASAAQAAGFRPCLRCRPETSPGTPGWLGTSVTVTRALKLINEGALDEAGLEPLAERLGVTPRHLRRLFHEHLGASPLAVAQTRRVHIAKTLLDTTILPVSEIALSAGYNSIRRFNTAFKEAFHKTPSAFRRPKASVAERAGATLELRLAYRPPLDWSSLKAFFAARALPGVEVVDGNVYRRTVRVGDMAGIIQISPQKGRPGLLLRVPVAFARVLMQVTRRVERTFDLGAVPEVIVQHLGQDPVLTAALYACPGVRVPGSWDIFETAIRAVLGQRVSVKAATAIAGRLVARCGDALPGPAQPGLTHLFPSPEQVASADLSGLGLPEQKIKAIRGLAIAVIQKDLTFTAFRDLEDAVARLSALPGIGPWTANYLAMRALGEPDAFPAGDLILCRAASQRVGKTLTPTELACLAERWRPWRAYAAMALWASYAPIQTPMEEAA